MPIASTGEPPTGDRAAGDPLIEQRLDRTLAPYADLFPPEVLADLRGGLADFMTTHPAMERMLARLRPAPVVEASGDQPTGAAGELGETTAPVASGGRR